VTEKLIFQSSIEALFVKALHTQVPPALKTELRGVGFDLDKPLPPAVTRELWYDVLERTARALFPGKPLPDAMRALGGVLFKGLEDSLLGKAIGPLARALGPSKLLKRVPHNMKTANNFADGRYDDVGPGEGVLWISDVGTSAEFTAGTMDAMLKWAGAASASVTIEPQPAPAAQYRMKWAG